MDEQKALRCRAVAKGLAAAAIYILCWVGVVLIDYAWEIPGDRTQRFLMNRVLPAAGIFGGTAALAWKDFRKLRISLLIVVLLWSFCIVGFAFLFLPCVSVEQSLYSITEPGFFIIYYAAHAINELLATFALLILIHLCRNAGNDLRPETGKTMFLRMARRGVCVGLILPAVSLLSYYLSFADQWSIPEGWSTATDLLLLYGLPPFAVGVCSWVLCRKNTRYWFGGFLIALIVCISVSGILFDYVMETFGGRAMMLLILYGFTIEEVLTVVVFSLIVWIFQQKNQSKAG